MKDSANRRRFATFVHTVLNNPYIKNKPTEKQAAFLMRDDLLEGFYGGAAGGGKSDALLMAALQYVDQPGYSALILRRTYADLSLPGALMERTFDWLVETDALWHDKSKTWRFPSGATLTFGYIEHEVDKYRYQGAEFQYVGFDELTQLTETKYQYLFSRVRRLSKSEIPIRIRSASNPGGIGHEWVKSRFISPLKPDLTAESRFFIPAILEDNPYLDQLAYGEALNKLDPVTHDQLRLGDWDVVMTGNLFKREWFQTVPQIPVGAQVRYWDLAATEATKGKDPDWTTGILMCVSEGRFYVKDVVRMRGPPSEVELMVKHCASTDGHSTRIVMEQEPGSSGIYAIDHFARYVLRGYNFAGDRVTGSKTVRAQPLSAACAQGNVFLPEGAIWITTLLHEMEQFPSAAKHDDQVDAMSGSFNALNRMFIGYYDDSEIMKEETNIPSLSSSQNKKTIFRDAADAVGSLPGL